MLNNYYRRMLKRRKRPFPAPTPAALAAALHHRARWRWEMDQPVMPAPPPKQRREPTFAELITLLEFASARKAPPTPEHRIG
jgi:hypothetical protein